MAYIISLAVILLVAGAIGLALFVQTITMLFDCPTEDDNCNDDGELV